MAWLSVLLLNLFLLFQYIYGSPRVDPLVDTELGLVRGLKASDGDYSMFLGVPYGKVNESNPFGTALPFPKFDDIFEAYDDSGKCPQMNRMSGEMVGATTLDCLTLNIYVPNSASSINRLPVLAFVHGGGFSSGSNERSSYGAKYIVRNDVILVTLNYRLGPYGFMCLNIPEVPGNQGLKDQLLAFRWIKDNIEAFGGDSRKITIFGESAGAMSVDLHLASEGVKSFNKAIIESGTSLSPVYYEPVKDAPIQIAKQLGFETDDLYDALSFLTATDHNLVIAAFNELGFAFTPCVEKVFDGVESFLSKNWLEKDLPSVKNMPIIIGFNSEEQFFNYYSGNNEYFQNLQLLDNKLSIHFDVNNEKLDEMKEVVRHFYFGDEEMSEDLKFDVINFDSDYTFNHPTHRVIEKYLKNDAGNVFFYVFSYVGEKSFSKTGRNVTDRGAAHLDELSYLFDSSSDSSDTSPDDQLTIDRMTTLWTNFAKYDNPTPETSVLLPVKWIPNTKDSPRYYLNIDSELTLNSRPFTGRMAFWDLFYKANKDLNILYPNLDNK